MSLLSRNPERIAWTTLIVAFVLFAILALAIPLSVRSFLFYATVPLSAQLRPISGTPLMWQRADEEALGVTDGREMSEDTRVRSPEAASAVVTFGQEADSGTALANVHLYSNSEVSLLKLREPRFALSPEPYRVELQVIEGWIRISAFRPAARALDLVVHTPHCRAELAAGSYSVQVSDIGTEIAVRYGESKVLAAGDLVTVGLGERTQVEWGQPPASPMPAARNLITNSDFSEPLTSGWQVDTYQQGADVVAGTAEITERAGQRSVLLSRRGEEGVHTETGISQLIDQDVQDYDFLNLRLDAQVRFQSLPGGGYLSSEFPLMVRLDYTDIYGKEQFWVHGFYSRDPEPNWPILDGERIPAFVWYPYESGNLVQLLPATRPARVNSIRIYASGHNYESMVTQVALTAR